MRVYYYSKDIVTNGTTTVAQFRVTGLSQLFNSNNGFYSLPYGHPGSPNEVCTSNITTIPTHATALGWNCFEVELAYDGGISNEYFHIAFYDQDIRKLKLSGILNLETNGTIITTDITNSAKPLLNLAGNAAGAALQNAYYKGKRNRCAHEKVIRSRPTTINPFYRPRLTNRILLLKRRISPFR